MKNNIVVISLVFFMCSIFFIHPFLYGQNQVGSDLVGLSEDDQLGYAVSLSDDGERVAVGAPGNGAGYVQVFSYDNFEWVQIGENIQGEEAGDFSGSAISLSGDGLRVAIGARQNNFNGGTGHVRVYEEQNGNWVQLGEDIDGEISQGGFGYSVSLSKNGSRVVIGTPFFGSTFTSMGKVRVFDFNNNSWTQVGQSITGNERNDELGSSLAISSNGNRFIVGAPQPSGQRRGYVQVFEINRNIIEQVGDDIIGEGLEDNFGSAVSISGDGSQIVVGARFNGDPIQGSGHVRVYEDIGGTWMQIGEDINGESSFEQFGWSVDISDDGNRIVAGARNKDTDSGRDSGGLRVFELSNNRWIQKGNNIDGQAEEDNFGWSVAISGDGDHFVGGGHRNSQIAEDAGHARVYEFMTVSNSSLFESNTDLIVYPIPTNDILFFSLTNNNQVSSVSILDTNGRVLRSFSEIENQVDLSGLASGLYYMHVYLKNSNSTSVAKIIVR